MNGGSLAVTQSKIEKGLAFYVTFLSVSENWINNYKKLILK